MDHIPPKAFSIPELAALCDMLTELRFYLNTEIRRQRPSEAVH
jgi:hypothetical protein